MIRGAKRRVSGGFTLVEVMMAMALFGIAVVAFSGAYINVINAFSAIQVDQPFEQDLSLIRQQVLIFRRSKIWKREERFSQEAMARRLGEWSMSRL